MRGSVWLNRLVRYILADRVPGGTGFPFSSTTSTICRSSLRCMPSPLPQDQDRHPPSEVIQKLVTDSPHVSRTASRMLGRRGSAPEAILLGAMCSLPALASRASWYSIDG